MIAQIFDQEGVPTRIVLWASLPDQYISMKRDEEEKYWKGDELDVAFSPIHVDATKRIEHAHSSSENDLFQAGWWTTSIFIAPAWGADPSHGRNSLAPTYLLIALI